MNIQLIQDICDILSKKYFDFGISTEQNGKYLNEGLIAQKEGFGGRTTCNQLLEMI